MKFKISILKHRNIFKNLYQVVLHFIIPVLFLDVRLLWSCCHTINNFVLKNFSRYIVIVSRDHTREYSIFFLFCTKQVAMDTFIVAENKEKTDYPKLFETDNIMNG